MSTKRIICLANSRKNSGRCVAGREFVGGRLGGWVRPISERPTHEVSLIERQYQDGGEPKVGDIIYIETKGAAPSRYQTENWVLDDGYYWVRDGRASWWQIKSCVETPDSLWPNGYSTKIGLNDQMPYDVALRMRTSLCFVAVSDLLLRVAVPGAAFGDMRRRVQAEFVYRQVRYRLWVTDPIVEECYAQRQEGDYPVGDCYVCVSLGEPHVKDSGERCVYKLAASIVKPEGWV